MEKQMGIANELIDDIRRERDMSTEQLAKACGYSRTQTNYYCNGQATPPAEFLASLFEATADLRIIKLVTGRRPVSINARKPVTIGDLSDPKTLNLLIEQRREAIEAESSLLQLFENGIDPTDPGERKRLEKYLREFDESVDAAFTVRDAVVALYESRKQRHESANRAKRNGQAFVIRNQ